MKKALVILLALTLVLGVAGTALAVDGGLFANTGNISDIKQKAEIVNVAEAKSGDATAVGNNSQTWVISKSKAKTWDKGDAKSESKVEVKNEGWATAISGDATAKNTGDNTINQKAEVKQEAKYDISVKLGFPVRDGVIVSE